MAVSDKWIEDGHRVEWGEKSWKLTKSVLSKGAPSYLGKKDGIEGFLTWQGRLLDTMGLVGHKP